MDGEAFQGMAPSVQGIGSGVLRKDQAGFTYSGDGRQGLGWGIIPSPDSTLAPIGANPRERM